MGRESRCWVAACYARDERRGTCSASQYLSPPALFHNVESTSCALLSREKWISCFYGLTWESFAISLDIGLTPMSTKRFTMLFHRINLELPTLSKRVGRLCTRTPNRSLSKIRHVHWPMMSNELLKHLEVCGRSFTKHRLALANNYTSPDHERSHGYMILIESPPPDQSRKKPDTRQRQDAGRPSKRRPEKKPNDPETEAMKRQFERFARWIEDSEAATGNKYRFGRYLLGLGIRLTGDPCFSVRPYSPPNSRRGLEKRASMNRRQKAHATRKIA
ncbi:hypothetical protein IQ06DRAFT_136603 [Phaeosphaeriaceae sp. SRC1lsM3a]|nr:hypothetical protein IQ06DRAFT_136603 [Stagonospora sp. SRC1lsM3a]